MAQIIVVLGSILGTKSYTPASHGRSALPTTPTSTIFTKGSLIHRRLATAGARRKSTEKLRGNQRHTRRGPVPAPWHRSRAADPADAPQWTSAS